MRILSIETSCDETAVAVIETKNNRVKILANLVSSQIRTHSRFGGVVPEVAARKHLERIVFLLDKAVKMARIRLDSVDFISVTQGPGLVASLLLGVQTAKALGYSLNKPVVPVNHLEGHFYINWLESADQAQAADSWRRIKKLKFPSMALIISGGHTKLALIQDFFKYKTIGTTLDDACGEALDKTAKLIGLGYPGGPELEKLAERGRADKYSFPRPLASADSFDFSFSGLKTSVLYFLRNAKKEGVKVRRADLAASVQEAVIDVLALKAGRAIEKHGVKELIIGGGVAANKKLRQRFSVLAESCGVRLHLPGKGQSTDNALMVALAAYFKIQKKIKYSRGFKADPSLPL